MHYRPQWVERNIAKSLWSGRLACVMCWVWRTRRFMGKWLPVLKSHSMQKVKWWSKNVFRCGHWSMAWKNREQIFFKGWIGSFEIYKGHVPNDIKGLIMRNLCQRFNLKYFTNDSYPNEDYSIAIWL